MVELMHNAGFFFTDEQEPIPLYLALATGGNEHPARMASSTNAGATPWPPDQTTDIYSDISKTEDDDESETGWSTDTEWWEREAKEDLWTEQEPETERKAAEEDPVSHARVVGCQEDRADVQSRCRPILAEACSRQEALRRQALHAPRATCEVRRAPTTWLLHWRALRGSEARPRAGDTSFFFQGKGGRGQYVRQQKGTHKAVGCYECGQKGHIAAECMESEPLCSRLQESREEPPGEGRVCGDVEW